jgi:hypothetical protein
LPSFSAQATCIWPTALLFPSSTSHLLLPSNARFLLRPAASW